MKRVFWISLLVIALFLLLLPTLISFFPLNRLWISKLEKRFEGKIAIDSASFSWFGPQKIYGIQYESSALKGFAKEIASAVAFWNIQNFAKQFELEGGALQTPEGLSLEQIHGSVSPSHTEIKGVSSQGGSFQIEQDGGQIHATLQKVPSIIFDRLLKADGILNAAVGSVMNLQGSWNVETQGFQFQIDATNASGSGTGTFRDGTILLSSRLSSSLLVTPALTNRLNLPPAQGQISLTLQPEQFRCPVPFQLKELRVDQGQLRVGTFQISTNSVLQKAGSLLKSSSLSNQSMLEVRSTPIDFSLGQGELRLERLDFLINRSIHFCLWGKVDLFTQNLRLYLGIPAQTLASLLNIPGLSSNAVLKIPVRGTISHPEVDTGPATAKIAALTATQLIPQKGFFKYLPKVVDATLDDQGDIPPQRYPIER